MLNTKTMKAAVVEKFGAPLVVREVESPIGANGNRHEGCGDDPGMR
jgi:hypothetical protein